MAGFGEMLGVDAAALEGRHQRLVLVVSASAVALGLLVALLSLLLAGEDASTNVLASLLVLFPASVSLLAATRDRAAFAAYNLLIGLTAAALVALVIAPAQRGIVLCLLAALVVLARTTMGRRACLALGLFAALTASAAELARSLSGGLTTTELLGSLFSLAGLSFIAAVARSLPSAREPRGIGGPGEREATGGTLPPKLMDSGDRLAAAASEIHLMASQQRNGALHQSSAVAETRETLRSMLEASAEIAETAKVVHANAEATLAKGGEVTKQVALLSGQTQRITEVVEAIRAIGNKSELLALNAALEGAKAGEAGRGFSLVAGRMGRLTESIMESLKDIRQRTADIETAAAATGSSMKEANALARATTEAGREISLITQQQRSSTEQIADAMDDIGEITAQVAASSDQTLSSTESLKEVANDLPMLLEDLVGGTTLDR